MRYDVIELPQIPQQKECSNIQITNVFLKISSPAVPYRHIYMLIQKCKMILKEFPRISYSRVQSPYDKKKIMQHMHINPQKSKIILKEFSKVLQGYHRMKTEKGIRLSPPESKRIQIKLLIE